MTNPEQKKGVFLSKPETSLPRNRYSQESILGFMKLELGENHLLQQRQLSFIYKQTQIDTRYSVLSNFIEQDQSWIHQQPAIEKRMEVYEKISFTLGKDLISKCLKTISKSGLSITDISHLVWVSCTGLTAPGIELQLRKEFPFRKNLETTAFNFLGCHGFFHALRFAAGIVKSEPDSKVLIVCVELCTLHFQNNLSPDQLLANSLFADGGASTLVTSQPADNQSIKINFQAQHHFPEGRNSMGWNVASRGFNMVLSTDLPSQIEKVLKNSLDEIFESKGIKHDEIKYWICHPGGRKILDTIQNSMNLQSEALQHSRKTMAKIGNVSSASILFVIQEFLDKNPTTKNQKGVLLGIGPGLILETVVFEY